MVIPAVPPPTINVRWELDVLAIVGSLQLETADRFANRGRDVPDTPRGTDSRSYASSSEFGNYGEAYLFCRTGGRVAVWMGCATRRADVAAWSRYALVLPDRAAAVAA